jgi:hypothetical protein
MLQTLRRWPAYTHASSHITLRSCDGISTCPLQEDPGTHAWPMQVGMQAAPLCSLAVMVPCC